MHPTRTALAGRKVARSNVFSSWTRSSSCAAAIHTRPAGPPPAALASRLPASRPAPPLAEPAAFSSLATTCDGRKEVWACESKRANSRVPSVSCPTASRICSGKGKSWLIDLMSLAERMTFCRREAGQRKPT